MVKTKRIYLKKYKKDDAGLLFQLDGDSDVMKYITLGVPRIFDEIVNESMPKILNYYRKNPHSGIFPAYLIESKEYIG